MSINSLVLTTFGRLGYFLDLLARRSWLTTFGGWSQGSRLFLADDHPSFVESTHRIVEEAFFLTEPT